MKKFAPFLIAAALLCAGCQSDESKTDTADAPAQAGVTTQSAPTDEAVQDTQETPAQTTEAAQTTAVQQTAEAPAVTTEADDTTSLLAGVWRVDIDGVPAAYINMSDDGKSGIAGSLEDGKTLEFTYIIGINEIDFTADGESRVIPITGGDQSYVMLDVDGKDVHMMLEDQYVPEDFCPYTNEQLCQLALDYYTAETGYTPTSAAALSNSDNTVTIHLYGLNQ